MSFPFLIGSPVFCLSEDGTEEAALVTGLHVDREWEKYRDNKASLTELAIRQEILVDINGYPTGHQVELEGQKLDVFYTLSAKLGSNKHYRSLNALREKNKSRTTCNLPLNARRFTYSNPRFLGGSAEQSLRTLELTDVLKVGSQCPLALGQEVYFYAQQGIYKGPITRIRFDPDQLVLTFDSDSVEGLTVGRISAECDREALVREYNLPGDSQVKRVLTRRELFEKRAEDYAQIQTPIYASQR